MRDLIKSLLREALDKTITCEQCGWDWKASESDKSDVYLCHKCDHDNNPKKSLNESIFRNTKDDTTRMNDFVQFAKKYLHLEQGSVELVFDRTELMTTAAYQPTNKKIYVYAKDRAVVDIMRSVAHEMVHLKQDIEGRLTNPAKDGMDGSPIEDEANATAGFLIRLYGRANPEIYI